MLALRQWWYAGLIKNCQHGKRRWWFKKKTKNPCVGGKWSERWELLNLNAHTHTNIHSFIHAHRSFHTGVSGLDILCKGLSALDDTRRPPSALTACLSVSVNHSGQPEKQQDDCWGRGGGEWGGRMCFEHHSRKLGTFYLQASLSFQVLQVSAKSVVAVLYRTRHHPQSECLWLDDTWQIILQSFELLFMPNNGRMKRAKQIFWTFVNMSQ